MNVVIFHNSTNIVKHKDTKARRHKLIIYKSFCTLSTHFLNKAASCHNSHRSSYNRSIQSFYSFISKKLAIAFVYKFFFITLSAKGQKQPQRRCPYQILSGRVDSSISFWKGSLRVIVLPHNILQTLLNFKEGRYAMIGVHVPFWGFNRWRVNSRGRTALEARLEGSLCTLSLCPQTEPKQIYK